MKIGEKHLLHKIQFPDIKNQGTDEFLVVEITEIRDDVPGMWGKDKYTGYKARSENGKILKLWWDRFPDDAMCPSQMWYVDGLPSPQYEVWYEVTQVGTLVDRIPQRPIFISKYDFIEYCEIHHTLFYTAKGEHESEGRCWNCWMDEKYPERAEKRKQERTNWLGWF